MNSKYSLTPEAGLYRITALRDVGRMVTTGDRGGLIASEKNLTVSGDAWVYGDARVYGDAEIFSAGHILWLTIPWTWSVTVYRTTKGHLIQAGCQRFTIDQVDAIASEHASSDPRVLAMLPGFIAMIGTFVDSWHKDTGVRR